MVLLRYGSVTVFVKGGIEDTNFFRSSRSINPTLWLSIINPVIAGGYAI